MKHATLIERFMEKCRRSESGCLEWTGAVQSSGYGSFGGGDGKSYLAHRWIWEYANGPIPDGLVLDHVCHNRKCQETAHMRTCSSAENILAPNSMAPSAENARRTACVEGHPFSGANLLIRPRGNRTCRECARVARRKYRARRQAEARL